MACSQERILAGALFRRCTGENSPSSFWRGRIRTVGKDHSTITVRGWNAAASVIELVSVDARGAEAAADWGSLKSPENYLGYERTENFASSGGAVLDKQRIYAVPARLRLNQWALSGDWTVQKQATVLNKANGRIAYRFHARDLHLVMGPAARGTSVRFRVLIDGQPPGAAHGIDVDDQGNGTVTEQRLYQLIRQPKPIAERQFEIEFLDSGVEAFAFTFG